MANGFNVTQDFVYDPRSLPRGQRLAFGPFEPDFVNLVELDTELIATDNKYVPQMFRALTGARADPYDSNPGVSPVFDSNSYVATIRNN